MQTLTNEFCLIWKSANILTNEAILSDLGDKAKITPQTSQSARSPFGLSLISPLNHLLDLSVVSINLFFYSKHFHPKKNRISLNERKTNPSGIWLILRNIYSAPP